MVPCGYPRVGGRRTGIAMREIETPLAGAMKAGASTWPTRLGPIEGQHESPGEPRPETSRPRGRAGPGESSVLSVTAAMSATIPTSAKVLIAAALTFVGGLALGTAITVSQRTRLKDERTSLQEKLQESKAEIHEARATLEELERQISIKDAIITELRDAPMLADELAGKEETIAELSAEVGYLKQRIAQCETDPQPGGSSHGSSVSGLESHKASGGQCTAITKKGTRCKRAAGSNGRCWQHGG